MIQTVDSCNGFGGVTQTGVITTYPTEPATCIGKAHVFECEHVTACLCGKIQRVMPRPKKAKRK